MKFLPLSRERWPDLEKLFGPRGACAGCWCMYWRLSKSGFEKQKGDSNRRAFRKLTQAGTEPGIIAYEEKEPIGWCAVAPRQDFPRLETSRTLARVDEKPVWSITCLFVAKGHRNSGLSTQLVVEATRFARKNGARIVEGYPYAPKGRVADVFAWTGLESSFRKAGFEEVARRSTVRPIMRRYL